MVVRTTIGAACAALTVIAMGCATGEQVAHDPSGSEPQTGRGGAAGEDATQAPPAVEPGNDASAIASRDEDQAPSPDAGAAFDEAVADAGGIGDGGTEGDSDEIDADSVLDDLPPGTRVISETFTMPAVLPGADQTSCVTRRLTNEEAVKVVEVRGFISPGSHHFMVDRTPIEVDVPVPVPCVGLAGTDTSRVLIAETKYTEFKMPEGVAFSMRPNQNLMMELHYYNYTGETMDVSATVHFILADEESMESPLEEAGMFFVGNPLLVLPPGAPGRAEFFGLPIANPDRPINVFALTSHTHSLGTRAWIERVPNAISPPGELLHESLSWAEPPMDQFHPPLEFVGQDGLRLTCEFFNDRPVPVTFGTRSVDEMCFMWVYYYPNFGPIF